MTARPNIGFISIWQNRGQAQVTRQIRSIFDAQGFNTFVMARPTLEESTMPLLVKKDGIWDAPNVTYGSEFNIPPEEYVTWVKSNQIHVVFCDMNFQYGALKQIQKEGVLTVGRFVWERMGVHQLEQAVEAYDLIYSLTRSETIRYDSMGVHTPRLRWGIHPELLEYGRSRTELNGSMKFVFHGGMLGRRKPVEKVVSAFNKQSKNDIELIIKSQATHRYAETVDDSDPRISHIQDDPDFEEYQRFLTEKDVLLAPSRWEGLGVHLYEAIAHGMPVISSDISPVDEVIFNGFNGLLTASAVADHTVAGLAIMEPDEDDLAEAIRRISDPKEYLRLAKNQIQMQDYFSWEKTEQDYLGLLKKLTTY